MRADSSSKNSISKRDGFVALIICLSLAALALIVLVAPRAVYPPLSSRSLDDLKLQGKDRIDARNDRLKLQNDFRATLVQTLGGAVVFIGAYVTWRQFHHNVESTREVHTLERERQVIELFTQAIDQLGSREIDVRVGGIFALERIANSSEVDRAAIAEVLSAYVRNRSPWPPGPDQASVDTQLRELRELRTHAADVQAAMTILGKHPHSWYSDEHLRFRYTDLRRVNLRNGHFENATFTEAHLELAWLPRAHFVAASFRGANLQSAWLEGADLRLANIRGTNFVGANLARVRLEGAKFDARTRWPDDLSAEAAKEAGAIEVEVNSPPSSAWVSIDPTI